MYYTRYALPRLDCHVDNNSLYHRQLELRQPISVVPCSVQSNSQTFLYYLFESYKTTGFLIRYNVMSMSPFLILVSVAFMEVISRYYVVMNNNSAY